MSERWPGAASPRSIVDLCDDYVEMYAEVHPTLSSSVSGGPDGGRLTDYSPDGYAARHHVVSTARTASTYVTASTETEVVLLDTFRERLSTESDCLAAHLPQGQLNVLDSPLHEIVMALDDAPKESAGDRGQYASLLDQVPDRLTGYRATLLAAASLGAPPALRQTLGCADLCEEWAGAGGPIDIASFDEPSPRDVERKALLARTALQDFATFLRTELAPLSRTREPFGRDWYALASRSFLGEVVDLDEAYAWGWHELQRVTQARDTAAQSAMGGTLDEVMAALDTSPTHTVESSSQFLEWMRDRTAETLASPTQALFPLDPRIRDIECRLAPFSGGAMYYSPPTEDLSRPGRIFWPRPIGRGPIPTWRQMTTVYHEGVPGHHVQMGGAVVDAGLTRWQRLLGHVDAHREGWALYAETIMHEQGFLQGAEELGYWLAQLLRAARVVADIGLHLEMSIPPGTSLAKDGYTHMTREAGVRLLVGTGCMDAAAASSEVDRYLGWAGQAPSYKLGERAWVAARAQSRALNPQSFSLQGFHAAALGLGPLGLATLSRAVGSLRL